MTNWSSLCPVAEAGLDETLTTLRSIVPELWLDVRCASNDALPFWVSASLNTAGPAADEDLVLFAGFKWSQDHIGFTCDISTGGGEVLVEGLHSTYLRNREGVEVWARACLSEFEKLCVGSIEMCRTALEARRDKN